MKKYKGILILTIFMIWYLIKNIPTFYTLNFTIDKTFYNYLLLCISGIIILFNIIGIYFLILKKEKGIIILKIFFILNISSIIIETGYSLVNFDTSKKDYIESKKNRGLNENTEIFTPTFIILSGIFGIIFFLYLINYINKSKEYFTQ